MPETISWEVGRNLYYISKSKKLLLLVQRVIQHLVVHVNQITATLAGKKPPQAVDSNCVSYSCLPLHCGFCVLLEMSAWTITFKAQIDFAVLPLGTKSRSNPGGSWAVGWMLQWEISCSLSGNVRKGRCLTNRCYFTAVVSCDLTNTYMTSSKSSCDSGFDLWRSVESALNKLCPLLHRTIRVLHMQRCRTSSLWPTEEILWLQEFTGSSRVSVHMDPEGKRLFSCTEWGCFEFQSFIRNMWVWKGKRSVLDFSGCVNVFVMFAFLIERKRRCCLKVTSYLSNSNTN